MSVKEENVAPIEAEATNSAPFNRGFGIAPIEAEALNQEGEIVVSVAPIQAVAINDNPDS